MNDIVVVVNDFLEESSMIVFRNRFEVLFDLDKSLNSGGVTFAAYDRRNGMSEQDHKPTIQMRLDLLDMVFVYNVLSVNS